jgi:hypothetical protein
VEYDLYDLRGAKVWSKGVPASLKSGIQHIMWNGRDAHNQILSSGIYIGCLKAGNREMATHKLMLIK